MQSDPTCVNDHPSVILVVTGGNLTLKGLAGDGFAGAIFVPDGVTNFNGAANYVATVFTKQFISSANDVIGLNDCYTKNTPVGILDPKPDRFLQVDSNS